MNPPDSNRHTPFLVTAVLVTVAIIAFAFFTGGCASGRNPLTAPVVVTNTVVSPPVTNVVVIPVPQPAQLVYVTNTVQGVASVVTNWVEKPPVVVTNVVVSPSLTNYVVATNYVANPELLAGLETARRVNSAVNPTPSAPFVDWGLTLIGGVATLVAGWQTRRASRADQAASRATLVADTVIKGIETYPGRELDRVKQHIAKVSELTGAVDLVDERVQAIAATVSGALEDGRIDANELSDLARNLAVGEADVPERYRTAFRDLRNNVLSSIATRPA